jgi:hypothetical protein
VIIGGGGESSTAGVIDATGGSGIGGATAFGGAVVSSATGEGGIATGSGLGGTVSFAGGGGDALSAAEEAGEGALGARIWLRNSVKETCFDGIGWAEAVSSEIGSSNRSSQR